MNDDPVKVADHKQWRAFQRVAVEKQLVIGRCKIFVLALVLKGEEVLLPHVGETVAAAMFSRALLETEGLAGRIGFGWRRVIDQAAQVDEMLLCCGALFQLSLLPLDDEFTDVQDTTLSIAGSIVAKAWRKSSV